MVYSLEMEVEVVDGRWIVTAPWLDEPIVDESFERAYERAVRARHLSSNSG